MERTNLFCLAVTACRGISIKYTLPLFAKKNTVFIFGGMGDIANNADVHPPYSCIVVFRNAYIPSYLFMYKLLEFAISVCYELLFKSDSLF